MSSLSPVVVLALGSDDAPVLADGSLDVVGSLVALGSSVGSEVADEDGSLVVVGSLDGDVLVVDDGVLDGVSVGAVWEPPERPSLT